MILRGSLALLCGTVFLAAQDRLMDVHRSTITVHVGKAGLFSVAGHEHWVAAPISSGSINESAPAHVEFTVEAARMQVKLIPRWTARRSQKSRETCRRECWKAQNIPKSCFDRRLLINRQRVSGVSKALLPAYARATLTQFKAHAHDCCASEAKLRITRSVLNTLFGRTVEDMRSSECET
jgi:hypothetical protein